MIPKTNRHHFLVGLTAASTNTRLLVRDALAFPPTRQMTRAPRFHWFGCCDKLQFSPDHLSRDERRVCIDSPHSGQGWQLQLIDIRGIIRGRQILTHDSNRLQATATPKDLHDSQDGSAFPKMARVLALFFSIGVPVKPMTVNSIECRLNQNMIVRLGPQSQSLGFVGSIRVVTVDQRNHGSTEEIQITGQGCGV